MKQRAQRTLARDVELNGVGLHTGARARLRMMPAGVGTGVVFRRVDVEGRPEVPARIGCMHDQPRRSSLREGAAEVHTVEHLLAALHAFSIDNVLCELDGPEVPGLDGSSRDFVRAIEEGGSREQRETVEPFALREPISLHDDEWAIVALPREQGLRLSYTLGFERPRPVHQTWTLDLSPETFVEQVASARTFCTSDEIELLRGAGLGEGANEENTCVISADAEADAARMRFPDEYVRHKILDLVGDLGLLGRPLHAHVVAHRTGHRANRDLVKRVQAQIARREELGHIKRSRGLSIQEIMRVLPHRYPMLLVDRVIEIDGFRRAVGIKNVTINEPYFTGHYPDTPIMPGVMTLEALAQLAGILLLRKLEYSGKVAVFLGMDRVRLRRAVLPGDQIRLEVETLHLGKRGGKTRARASVRGTMVAEAEMKFMLVDSPSNVEDQEL